nr:uncharacterized protein LOC112757684 [Arachis hypogaea]
MVRGKDGGDVGNGQVAVEEGEVSMADGDVGLGGAHSDQSEQGAQNEEIEQKRKLVKQKAKLRGLRGDDKMRMVKDLKYKFNLSMIGLIETKRQVVTRINVNRFCGCTGTGWEYVGSDGASGGLLMIWDDTFLNMNNCYKGERWLCVEGVLLKNSFNCAFFLIYGAHSREEKSQVWEELSYIADRKFTWFRGCSCSCLDRALVSVEWLEEFPETRLQGGSRGLSDHCLIIVEEQRMKGDPRPFRSLDAWFIHDGFLRMVKEEWRGLGELQFIDKLKELTDPLRSWHKHNFGEMKNKILKFEEEIKKVDDMESSPLLGFRDGLVGRIDEEESVSLEVMPSAEEIRQAVWDCESSKTPGCDGFNMNFIKRCWDEIGTEFTGAVMGFFQTVRLPADSNIMWVALAPKFTGAKEMKDLKPISMVGCVYKVISKVLVRRMRAVMPGLVGETQSTFVQGRRIHDGALIACETMHCLKRIKGKAAIIKLDFQKAYDRVKMGFVDIVLEKMGFGRRWRTWVMECVTTASMSVLINGSPSKSFKIERSLRQGDLLSPFLFVLVVDVLHRMIGEAVRNGRISPLVVGRDRVKLSHLQFPDDTILFYPPDDETMQNYKRLLRWFELMSGLSINFDKSSLISLNCEEQWVQRMCRLWGCKEGTLPVKYLGVPLGANPRLVKTWKPIIDKVEEKLSLWKAKVLNKAEKLVLIKSVLNSLPVYYLSLYKMPKAIAEKLISLQRRFLWSKEDGRQGMVLVKWELVQAPKKFGGLEVGDAMVRITVLLFKWWWRFAKEECPLWKKVVIQEGMLSEDVTSYSFTKTIWKGLAPPRVELFVWFVLVGKVNTKEPLSRLGVIDQDDKRCVLCNKEDELIHHLFLGCDFAWQVWSAWISAFGRPWAFLELLKDHFLSWTDEPRRKEDRKQHLRCFCAIIWHIWLERNRRLFQNEGKGVEEIITMAALSCDEWRGKRP